MTDQKTSKIAITAFVMGILSLILGWIPILGWIFIILSIVFGIIGLKKTKNNKLKGRWMAITGLSIGSTITVLIIILFGAGGLMYFGILNPTEFLPERCTVSPGFECLGHQLISSGDTLTINVDLNNVLGKPINLNSYSVTSELLKSSVNGDYSKELFDDASSKSFSFDIDKNNFKDGQIPEKGSKNMFKINIKYLSEDSLVMNDLNIELFGTVQ